MALTPSEKQKAYRERQKVESERERLARDPRRTWPIRPQSILTDFDQYPDLSPRMAAIQASRDREWAALKDVREKRLREKVVPDLK